MAAATSPEQIKYADCTEFQTKNTGPVGIILPTMPELHIPAV